jgi:hypothetical protein
MNADYLKLAGRIMESAGKLERAEHYYEETLKWGGDDADTEQRLRELRKGSRSGLSGLFH